MQTISFISNLHNLCQSSFMYSGFSDIGSCQICYVQFLINRFNPLNYANVIFPCPISVRDYIVNYKFVTLLSAL